MSISLKKISALLSACLFLFCLSLPARAGISKTSKKILRPSSPVSVSASDFSAAAVSTESIRWSWSTGTFTGSGIDGYYLYSSSTSDRITLLPDTSFYIDSGLAANRQYTRWLTAYQGSSEGSDSDHIDKFTYALPPDSFSYDHVTSTGAYITWLYSSATAYEIQCSTNGGADYVHNRAAFVPWQTIPLLSNKNYLVRLGAINGDNELTPGIYSAEDAFITPPFTPESMSAVAISSYSIQWTWSTGTFTGTGITGYRIYHSTLTADGEIPAAGDRGEAIVVIGDPDVNSWTETYVDSVTLFADSRHTRWLTAVGISESNPSSLTRKFTYAVAPATCALVSPGFQNISETSLNLIWDPSLASKYVIEYSTAADFGVSLSSRVVAGSSMVPGLTANTKYDFRIGAINGDNEQTPDNAQNTLAYSAAFKVLTRPKPLLPSAAAVTDTAIKWSWSTETYESMDYISGYSIGIASHTEELGDFVLAIDNIPDINTKDYTLDYLLTNSTHTRFVSAEQSAPGYESYGSVALAATGATFATPPNDVAFGAVGARSVGLWWKEPIVPATQYRVERSTTIGEKGPWVFVSSVTGALYGDTGLSPSTTYSYRIGAINQLGIQTLGLAAATGGNRRDYSFISSTITLQGAPDLNAVVVGTDSITWWWASDNAGVQSFNLYTSTDGILAAGLSASTTYWTETGLSANTRYARRLRSVTSRGEGDFSEGSAATFANPPGGLTVSTAGLHSLTVNWTLNGSSAYRIDRSQDLNNWTTLKNWTDVFVSSSLTDTHLHYAATYYYAVSGYNEDGVMSVSSAVYAGRTPDLPGYLAPVYSTATAAQGGTAYIPGVGQITVSMPPGSPLSDGYIFISTDAALNPAGNPKADLDAAAAKLPPSRLVGGAVTELYFYDAFGYLFTGNFGLPVRITFTYLDADNNLIVDGYSPPIAAGSLKVFNLDTAALVWNPLDSSKLDTAARTVYADVQHFSYYALGSLVPVAESLAHAFAYPNPYRPGSGGAFDQSAFGDGIVFESLPPRAKIRIYNVAGGLVAELDAVDGAGRFLWNVRNSNGSRVASGLYFYLITNKDNAGDKTSGKITIIK